MWTTKRSQTILNRFYRLSYKRCSSSLNTVNKDEIERFAALSREWWDPNGAYRILHQMNPTRIHFLRERLGLNSPDPFPFRNKNMLDIGCGGGLFAESLSRLGANVLALDATYNNVQTAKHHANNDPDLNESTRSKPGKLEYLHTSAEQLATNSSLQGTFDVITCMEVLEHVDQPAAFLKLVVSLLRPSNEGPNGEIIPGGQLILSTISRTPLSYFITVFMAENILRLVPKETHTWDKFVKPSELVSFAQTNLGLIDSEVRGTMYIPWEGRWRLAHKNQPWTAFANYFFAATRSQ